MICKRIDFQAIVKKSWWNQGFEECRNIQIAKNDR